MNANQNNPVSDQTDKLSLSLNAMGKALQRLAESLAFDQSQPLVVDASIQRFEFCIELTWKTMKKALTQEGIEANTPRECMQQAYAAKWLDDETAWLSMLRDRNLTSHTYKEDLALEIYQRLPGHLTAMQALHQLLVARFDTQVTE
ncbi:nucleotidyltransferase substrate binding protein (TIGR01987 family) [Oceanisphaera litoralis]|uniref:HI0074 family nucleotidyltransferase substrate-binding subunit n=1 Tax=Oceanisphaera litoralis TaxID=225144 RepID=UPI001EF906CE|nr:HI0074 family nucleotidyltransferase substrate-binding subunit [Oceanisphaera litoralis]MBM7455267.1 nucleotidyltransferase substrate binding protein (TIGR01987 family) [Oceanisphaera litoralis]